MASLTKNYFPIPRERILWRFKSKWTNSHFDNWCNSCSPKGTLYVDRKGRPPLKNGKETREGIEIWISSLQGWGQGRICDERRNPSLCTGASTQRRKHFLWWTPPSSLFEEMKEAVSHFPRIILKGVIIEAAKNLYACKYITTKHGNFPQSCSFNLKFKYQPNLIHVHLELHQKTSDNIWKLWSPSCQQRLFDVQIDCRL